MSNISIIIQREFNERVRKKSFIITTLLMPVLMIALMAAPALIMQFSRGDEKVIAVIDESGLIAPKLESDEEIRFETTELPTEEARRELTEKFGVLWIGGDILENSNNVRLYANSSSSLALESNITGQIERILETEKLKAYNIENLSQILEQVETKVVMQTFRNDKSQEEDAQAQSSAVATGLGYVLGFILYMFLLIYGASCHCLWVSLPFLLGSDGMNRQARNGLGASLLAKSQGSICSHDILSIPLQPLLRCTAL